MLHAAKKFHRTLFFIAKAMLIWFLFLLMIYVWANNYQEASYDRFGNYVFMLSYGCLLMVFITVYGAGKVGANRLGDVIFSFLLAILFTNFITYLQFCLIARKMLPVLPILLLCASQLLVSAAGSYLLHGFYLFLFPAADVLVIRGKNTSTKDIVHKLETRKDHYTVREIAGEELGVGELTARIDRYQTILLAEMDTSLRQELLDYCYRQCKSVYILPTVSDLLVRTSMIEQVSDSPVFFTRGSALTTEQALVKRLMDLVLSFSALLVTAPLMFILCVLIRAYDGGPVFFKQERVTRDNRIFTIYKFRSMVVDAEKDGAVKAVKADPRITPVGKVMRKLRLDELPQLLNILKGEMSIVGPRPERTENVDEYGEVFPQFALRHKVKAGLTGYAQIYGKYNTSPRDKLLLDLIYIENYSLLLDIKLLLITLKILFLPESTEGFDLPAEDGLYSPKLKIPGEIRRK